MKATSGEHFVALDHVRAFAAYLVIVWHFNHGPIPFDYTPSLIPFALLDEGHTGVALFMTLSGYLFSKLLFRKSFDYAQFLKNRALRLLPLLVLAIVAGAMNLGSARRLLTYGYSVVKGALLPTLPNGGWSVTVEAHFYLLLPILLALMKRSRLLLVAVLLIAIATRCAIYWYRGEVQLMAYWTIVGRIDQFILGMLAFSFRTRLAARHAAVFATGCAFLTLYWVFDLHGGFFANGGDPSPGAAWIVLPTLEGLAYAIFIAWYDTSFSPRSTGTSGILAKAGQYSYSIYLLHFFFVFDAAKFINEHVSDLSNFYWASVWALLFMFAMMPVGYLSYRFVEAPFLRLRRPYVTADRHQFVSPISS
ncbi:MAG: acyltransferase [Pseudomonadota bacterium]